MEHKLAQIVCGRFPAMERARFVNSGTEANMIAIATAIVHTGKRKILIFNKGYHGSTISGTAVSGEPNINLPHDFVIGTYNDVKATKAIVDSLPRNELAAILVEPMLGSGGCFCATREFLSSLRSLATDQKALLIFDEVMTSRLSYHGLSHKLGIHPDLMTVGKWVGGGMSFGAFGGKEEIMRMYDPREGKLEHPGTFNNNVFSMSAGIAGCTLLDETTLDDLNRRGDSLRADIQNVLHEANIIGEVPSAPLSDDMHNPNHPQRPPKMFVIGRGSLMNIHFAGPERELLQALFYLHILDQGIWIAPRGFIALSIEINFAHQKSFIIALKGFCERWSQHLKWKTP
jgi:glutamate-1-semialdehyde 2,1-aminomutase